MRKKLLIIGIIIVVCLIGGYLFLLKQTPPSPLPPLPLTKELKLSDFPEVFKENTLIVIGDNAFEIEMQAANSIASYLENETGNKPLVKKYSEVSNEDKKKYNLIVVGTSKTNNMLKGEEVHELTNTTKLPEEYSEKNGVGTIVQILRNPWNEERRILIIQGNSAKRVIDGINELYSLQTSGQNVDIMIIGTIGFPMTQVAPSFENCISPSPYIKVDSRFFYLTNICRYLNPFAGDLGLFGKTVKIEGKLVKREVEVSSKLTTTIRTFDNVIEVSTLEVIK